MTGFNIPPARIQPAATPVDIFTTPGVGEPNLRRTDFSGLSKMADALTKLGLAQQRKDQALKNKAAIEIANQQSIGELLGVEVDRLAAGEEFDRAAAAGDADGAVAALDSLPPSIGDPISPRADKALSKSRREVGKLAREGKIPAAANPAAQYLLDGAYARQLAAGVNQVINENEHLLTTLNDAGTGPNMDFKAMMLQEYQQRRAQIPDTPVAREAFTSSFLQALQQRKGPIEAKLDEAFRARLRENFVTDWVSLSQRWVDDTAALSKGSHGAKAQAALREEALKLKSDYLRSSIEAGVAPESGGRLASLYAEAAEAVFTQIQSDPTLDPDDQELQLGRLLDFHEDILVAGKPLGSFPEYRATHDRHVRLLDQRSKSGEAPYSNEALDRMGEDGQSVFWALHEETGGQPARAQIIDAVNSNPDLIVGLDRTGLERLYRQFEWAYAREQRLDAEINAARDGAAARDVELATRQFHLAWGRGDWDEAKRILSGGAMGRNAAEGRRLMAAAESSSGRLLIQDSEYVSKALSTFRERSLYGVDDVIEGFEAEYAALVQQAGAHVASIAGDDPEQQRTVYNRDIQPAIRDLQSRIRDAAKTATDNKAAAVNGLREMIDRGVANIPYNPLLSPDEYEGLRQLAVNANGVEGITREFGAIIAQDETAVESRVNALIAAVDPEAKDAKQVAAVIKADYRRRLDEFIADTAQSEGGFGRPKALAVREASHRIAQQLIEELALSQESGTAARALELAREGNWLVREEAAATLNQDVLFDTATATRLQQLEDVSPQGRRLALEDALSRVGGRGEYGTAIRSSLDRFPLMARIAEPAAELLSEGVSPNALPRDRMFGTAPEVRVGNAVYEYWDQEIRPETDKSARAAKLLFAHQVMAKRIDPKKVLAGVIQFNGALKRHGLLSLNKIESTTGENIVVADVPREAWRAAVFFSSDPETQAKEVEAFRNLPEAELKRFFKTIGYPISELPSAGPIFPTGPAGGGRTSQAGAWLSRQIRRANAGGF